MVTIIFAYASLETTINFKFRPTSKRGQSGAFDGLTHELFAMILVKAWVHFIYFVSAIVAIFFEKLIVPVVLILL